MEVSMFRKMMSVSILGFVLAGALVSAPANAATIANGTLCPKAMINKTIKVSGYLYKCTKNPIVNKTKYTWTSVDCIKSNASYVKENAAYLVLARSLPATLAALDLQIAAQQVKAQQAATKADALDAQAAAWKAKVVEFTAARDALVAQGSTKFLTAITTYNSALHSLTSAINSNTVAAASMRRVGSSVATMQASRATTISALAQTKAFVAQALKMRNLVCQKGM